MFSFLDYSGLQHYWWIIVSLLGALLVFMLFVQVADKRSILSLAKTEKEKTMLLNATGRKWRLHSLLWLLLVVPFLRLFHCFYSTSFGGAYWVWMAILFCIHYSSGFL